MQCQKDRGDWLSYNSNFDNVGNALETLFIVSTLDNWVAIMQNAMDTTSVD